MLFDVLPLKILLTGDPITPNGFRELASITQINDKWS